MIKESTLTKSRPWHRRKTETSQQFRAFTIYLETGGSHIDVSNALYRTGESAANLYKKAPGNIAKWATKHQWLQRRLAYSDHLDQVRQKAVENEIRQDGADWAKRRGELDDKIMRASEAILERINEMLSFPLVRKQTEREEKDTAGNIVKKITIQEPARWNLGTVAPLLAVAKDGAEEVSRRQVGVASEYGEGGEVEAKLLRMIEAADQEENGSTSGSD